MSCSKCKYWVQLKKEFWGIIGFPLGECHYNAPHPAWFKIQNRPEISDQMISWPLTKHTDFCSVEEERESEKPKEPEKPKGLLRTLFNGGS